MAGKRFAGRQLRVTLEVMMVRIDDIFAPARSYVATAIAATMMLLIAASAAWAQTPPPPPAPGVQQPAQPATPPQEEPPPPPRENPGLINEIGKLFDKLPTIKGPQETIDDLNARAKGAAKDASDSISRLAKPSSMVSGRSVCPVSANGAPDCKLGADRLCQSKGYQAGSSLTSDSVEKCSAKVLIPGRARKPDDCHTDNFVTSALCQ
jgi:hypothetical protein